MRICLFTENYHAGGMDTWIANLINYWPDENDEFYLVCNYDHPGLSPLEKRLKRDCKIIRHRSFTPTKLYIKFSSNKLLNFVRKVLMSAGQYFVFFYHFFYFNSLLHKIAPDKLIVVNGGYPGGNTCRAAALNGLLWNKWGKPILVYHNDAIKARFPFSIIEYFVDKLLEKSVSRLITVSKATQNTLNNRPGLRKSRKKMMIYNGVEQPKEIDEKSLKIKNELGISAESKILLMLGTYEERKGHDFAFKALKIIGQKTNHDVCLVAAGYGRPKDNERLLNLVTKYKLEGCVHLLGFRSDVPELLSQSDILVVPSQCEESFGMVIVEAMSYAVPVVATNIGGISEVLQNKGGFLVEKNIDDFTEKIIYLLEEEGRRREIGMEGYRQVMNRFNVEKMTKKYYDLL